MKKSIFTFISISLVFLSFCRQKVEKKAIEQIEEESLNILKYRVLENSENENIYYYGREYRMEGDIEKNIVLEVEKLPSKEQMEKTARHIWKNSKEKSFTVYMYLPEMDVKSSAYGRGKFNPYGIEYFITQDSALKGTKWSPLKKEEKKFIPYLTEKPFRLTIKKRKQIYLEYTMDPMWKYDDGTDWVPKKLAEKYMKKYNLTRSELAKILFEGAEKYW